MTTTDTTIQQALTSFDRALAAQREAHGEETRKEMVARFPIDGWATMPLEGYALGQEDSSETYCRWAEFKSTDLGSISGGSSFKHIIFKRRNKPGWAFPQRFGNEREAWESLRADFQAMLNYAREGRWEAIPDLMPFQYGPAMSLKTLHLYFPAEVLPVYSSQHLAHFNYRVSGVESKVSRKLPPLMLNRQVLDSLRAIPELAGLSSVQLGYFLYHWADPRLSAAIYKIAPGEEAKFWDECLRGGYVCVGWGEVGDLTGYEDLDALDERFRTQFAGTYGDTPAGKATMTRKARELWRLTEIEPGDRIVANKGLSKILGVGEVLDPPYEFATDGSPYPHRIRVKWDTSLARDIPPQRKWAFVTIAPVSQEQYERFLAAGPIRNGRRQPLPPDPELAMLAERLEERKQLILYGPPGTGKTYKARRFLLHWLLTAEGRSPGEVLADPRRAREEWARLTSPQAGLVPQVTVVTFHPSYTYEDFVEGFRPVEAQEAGLRLKLEDGVFKRVCAAATLEPGRKFVVLIDEINRGNLPRILGELITVLEADKRGLSVMLPQSKQPFSVPGNVYVVGTMNTADRSIRVLDAAVRRRFAFHELMPEESLLAGQQFGDLVLEDFLRFLNGRIAKLEGREKQIGHAVFIDDEEPVEDVEEFAKRLRYEVIPLVQEYCYEDYRRLAEYLGNDLVDVEAQRLRAELLAQPEALAAALAKFINGQAAV